MSRTNHRRLRAGESGNIFTFLFGAVAVVGIITATTMQLISGPIKTASRVNSINMANASMQAAGRILIIDAATQANSGDVDSDGTIEPRAFTTQSGGITGGGSIPLAVGASRTDPWGTLYGYCVWNNGSSYGALTNILAGAATSSSPVPTVIALVSAGPNKTFQTSCAAYSGGTTSNDGTSTGVIQAAGDDIVMKWTYAEALAASAGLWAIKGGAPDTATIGKNLEVTDPNNANAVTASINRSTGIGDFLGVTTDLISAKTGATIRMNASQIRLQGTTPYYAFWNNNPTRLGYIQHTDTPSNNLAIVNEATGGSVLFYTNATEKMRLDSNGNLGVGILSPANVGLTAYNGAADSVVHLSTTNNAYDKLAFRLSHLGDTRIPRAEFFMVDSATAVDRVWGLGYSYSSGAPADFVITNNNAASVTGEAMRIQTGTGNVGIGTTTPSYKLTLVDTLDTSSTSDYSQLTQSTVSDAGSGGSHAIGNYTTLAASTARTGNPVGAARFDLNLQHTAGTSNSAYGAMSRAHNTNAGTVSELFGAYNLGSNQATGTVSNLYGSYNYGLNHGASSVVTSLYGSLSLGQNGNNSAITNIYGGYNIGRADNTSTTAGNVYGSFNHGYLTSTGTATQLMGSYNYASQGNAGGTSTNMYGAYNFAQPRGTNTGAYGSYNRVDTISTSTNNTVTGTIGYILNQATATAATMTGTSGYINNSGTVTTMYGLHSRLVNSGTITNYYGLFIDLPYTTSGFFTLYSTSQAPAYLRGNLGIGTGKTSPSTAIDVNGTVTATNVTLTSDARKKTNVEDFTKGLEDVLRLRPVSFEWKQGTEEAKVEKGRFFGLIAQEVEKIFPEIVRTDNKGFKSVDYVGLFAPVIDAIQSLFDKVEAIVKRLDALEARIDTLEKENAALKAKLDAVPAQ